MEHNQSVGFAIFTKVLCAHV